MNERKKNYSVGIQTGVEHGKYYMLRIHFFFVIHSTEPMKVHIVRYGVVTGANEISSVEKKEIPTENIGSWWRTYAQPLFTHIHACVLICIQHNTKFIIFIINHKYQSWNQNTEKNTH